MKSYSNELKVSRQDRYLRSVLQSFKRVSARQELSTAAARARSKKRAHKYALSQNPSQQLTVGTISNMADPFSRVVLYMLGKDPDLVATNLALKKGILAKESAQDQQGIKRVAARKSLSTPSAKARAKVRAKKYRGPQSVGLFDGSNSVEQGVNALWSFARRAFGGAQASPAVRQKKTEQPSKKPRAAAKQLVKQTGKVKYQRNGKTFYRARPGQGRGK